MFKALGRALSGKEGTRLQYRFYCKARVRSMMPPLVARAHTRATSSHTQRSDGIARVGCDV